MTDAKTQVALPRLMPVADESPPRRMPVLEELKAAMAAKGLGVGDLADEIDKTRQTVSLILNGHSGISKDVSRRFGEVFGNDALYWYERSRREEIFTLPGLSGLAGQILVDHRIEAANADGDIKIDPLEPSCIRQASVDLRLGSTLVDLNAANELKWDRETLTLQPWKIVNFSTREFVDLKNRCVGLVGSPSALERRGIRVGHGQQVDPGFKGHLQGTLLNQTSEPVTLDINEPIITLALLVLNDEPRQTFGQDLISQDELMTAGKVAVLQERLRPLVARRVNTATEDGETRAEYPGVSRFARYNVTSEQDAIDAIAQDMAKVVYQAIMCDRASSDEAEQARRVLRRAIVREEDFPDVITDLGGRIDQRSGRLELPWVENTLAMPALGGDVSLVTALELLNIGAGVHLPKMERA